MKRVYNLFLAIFRAGDEIHGFHMPNVDFVPKNIREDDFGHISAAVVQQDPERSVGVNCTFSSDIRPNYRLLKPSASIHDKLHGMDAHL